MDSANAASIVEAGLRLFERFGRRPQVQARWRGHRLRTIWKQEDAAMLCQAAWRGMKARWGLVEDEAAILLQSLARGHLARLDL